MGYWSPLLYGCLPLGASWRDGFSVLTTCSFTSCYKCDWSNSLSLWLLFFVGCLWWLVLLFKNNRYSGDMRRQVDETESVKELLNTYEQSIERKDQVIANLTASLQSHRDKMEIQKSFSEWKIKHNDVKREVPRSLSLSVCLSICLSLCLSLSSSLSPPPFNIICIILCI